jgi:hypothetical protein
VGFVKGVFVGQGRLRDGKTVSGILRRRRRRLRRRILPVVLTAHRQSCPNRKYLNNQRKLWGKGFFGLLLDNISEKSV